MFRTLTIPLWCAVVFTPLVLLYSGVVLAQAMSGSSYQIESDSINVGGAFSESDSFQLEDTTGEVATGFSESDSFELRAGYQQMQAVTLAMSQPDPVSLSPALSGVTGGVSNGSTTINVITDNPAGYELLISASTDPAMQSEEYTIADYQPSGAAPDLDFTTASTSAHFGFSVESVDASSRFFNNGSSCDTGDNNTPLVCWDGLSMDPTTVAATSTSNHPDGTDTIIHFRVGVGDSVMQPPGTYVATTTITAIPL